MNVESIIGEVSKKLFKPVYLLHGEEAYYIDVIGKAIYENALEEQERDFNQTIVYGKDTDVLTVISEAKGYPMMSERRLVIVREAQDLKDIDRLEAYCSQPNPTTVLVLEYKYKKFDSRKKIVKEIAKNGIVFQSDKIKDYQLTDWINKYLAKRNYSITPKASQLLADSLGNDLSKVTNELNKLELLLQAGTTINEIHIEENIGISKDFNVFELVNALAVRDIPKAFQIVDYFAHNPKAGPLVMIVSSLFTFYSRLMRIQFAASKMPEDLARQLGVHPFAVKELIQASKIYPPKKAAANISVLYDYDLKSKGVNNSSMTEGELMKEMIYKLMH
ncbi:MAG: DNA polymerase III subunit delta [Flavobacteriia bacterium 40-80]|nr:MAG: DNA polymerase III subunit delta [Flavobacteriia bacterium 40-80]